MSSAGRGDGCRLDRAVMALTRTGAQRACSQSRRSATGGSAQSSCSLPAGQRGQFSGTPDPARRSRRLAVSRTKAAALSGLPLKPAGGDMSVGRSRRHGVSTGSRASVSWSFGTSGGRGGNRCTRPPAEPPRSREGRGTRWPAGGKWAADQVFAAQGGIREAGAMAAAGFRPLPCAGERHVARRSRDHRLERQVSMPRWTRDPACGTPPAIDPHAILASRRRSVNECADAGCTAYLLSSWKHVDDAFT